MTRIRVNADSYTEQVTEPTGDDWDWGETVTDHCINNFQVVKENEHSHLVVNLDPKPGVPYYLLYAVYSTGDSFGWDAGKCIEFIELYQSFEKAEENMDKLNCDQSSEVKIESETGEVYNFFIPWNGYFESLDHVGVEKVYMK